MFVSIVSTSFSWPSQCRTKPKEQPGRVSSFLFSARPEEPQPVCIQITRSRVCEWLCSYSCGVAANCRHIFLLLISTCGMRSTGDNTPMAPSHRAPGASPRLLAAFHLFCRFSRSRYYVHFGSCCLMFLSRSIGNVGRPGRCLGVSSRRERRRERCATLLCVLQQSLHLCEKWPNAKIRAALLWRQYFSHPPDIHTHTLSKSCAMNAGNSR